MGRAGPPGQVRSTKLVAACSIEDAPMKEPPHYLRFARALALVGTLGGAASGCCPMVPDSVACAHCTCSGQLSSASRPLACDTIHRDTQCCTSMMRVPVVGPLAPPSLPS